MNTTKQGRGTELRDEALALAEKYRSATVLKARRLLLQELLRSTNPVTIDGIRHRLTIPPLSTKSVWERLPDCWSSWGSFGARDT